jgi:hypothetical protein
MALVRRSAWLTAGGYTHIEGGRDDYDLWRKLMTADFHGERRPRLLAIHRSRQDSINHTTTSHQQSSLIGAIQKRHPWLELLRQS